MQQQGNCFLRVFVPGLLMAGLLLVCGSGFAQTKPAVVPDAQIEANVLKALAGAPELADQAITSTTVFGTVTLKGTVRDEASRDMAEKLVSNAAGVQKVVDELTIGTGAVAGNGSSQGQGSAEEGTNPNLQSDGTMAPPQTPQDQNSPNPPVAPQENAPQPGGQYPPSAPPPYRQPYAGPNGPPQPGYGQQPYVEQRGGDAVVVPSGSVLRVRVNQGMDSKHTAPGTVFDGVVLSDVVAGGFVAIPRGAAVQGRVVDANSAGELKGRGALLLQLTEVTLGGRTYPVASNLWSHQGADKTANTVGNTVGLGAVGALIGAVAGGGVGAVVGAGVGGAAGLGVSSMSGAGEAMVPPEAILNFRLTQPLELTTVSQAELNRLGSGVPLGGQPQMRRRSYPPPPPPPSYYYPGYYNYPW
jgi:hypothetical protein